jgi:capsular polysaccharide biosynthesis protein
MPDRSGRELVEGQARLDSLPTGPGGSPVSPKVKVTALQPSHPRLASFYEATAFNTLRALWRRRLLIVSCLAAGLVIAVIAIAVIAKRYTAEAVIQLDFAAREGAAAAAPGATIDAAILVEGEARLIRSPTLARRVVTRLKLEENPTYTSVGPLSRILRYVSPPPPGAPEVSKADVAAAKLVRQLQVTNDPRSYLINVTIVSNSPDWSATLANAFATEYLQHRIIQQLRQVEARARAALQAAGAFYGEKHPNVIQAKTQLEGAEARLREQEGLSSDRITPPPGYSYLKAEPVWLPSGPNPVALLGMGVFGSLLAGVGLALLLERSNRTLRTERSVAVETGIRCVGMIPKRTDRASADRKLEQREAFRSLCLALGLAGQRAGGAPILMISSALPANSTTGFVRGLAASLKEDGKRVLIIDLAEQSAAGKGISLDDVVHNPALIREFVNEEQDQPVSELRRNSGLNGVRNPLASFAKADWAFEQLLDETKPHYDVLIMDTPPTLLFSDSIFLGRFADLSLHVVVWNKTPRETVLEAIRRLQEHMVRIDGIVLVEIDLNRYPSFEAGDRTYYLSKYDKLFSADS